MWEAMPWIVRIAIEVWAFMMIAPFVVLLIAMILDAISDAIAQRKRRRVAKSTPASFRP